MYVYIGISSHCENWFENGVGIQELPNTGNNPGFQSLEIFKKMKEPLVLVFEEKKKRKVKKLWTPSYFQKT